MSKNSYRPFAVYVLILLVLIQGISGIAGGIGLVGDPTGDSLQIPIEWLKGSPFNNYFIPGFILLLILGVFPVITFFGLIRQLNWSWWAALFIGIALIIWIVTEIIIIGYHHRPPLQLTYGTVGILLLVFSLLPSVRNYFTTGE